MSKKLLVSALVLAMVVTASAALADTPSGTISVELYSARGHGGQLGPSGADLSRPDPPFQGEGLESGFRGYPQAFP